MSTSEDKSMGRLHNWKIARGLHTRSQETSEQGNLNLGSSSFLALLSTMTSGSATLTAKCWFSRNDYSLVSPKLCVPMPWSCFEDNEDTVLLNQSDPSWNAIEQIISYADAGHRQALGPFLSLLMTQMRPCLFRSSYVFLLYTFPWLSSNSSSTSFLNPPFCRSCRAALASLKASLHQHRGGRG